MDGNLIPIIIDRSVNTGIRVSGPIEKPKSSPVFRDIVVESLRESSDATIWMIEAIMSIGAMGQQR